MKNTYNALQIFKYWFQKFIRYCLNFFGTLGWIFLLVSLFLIVYSFSIFVHNPSIDKMEALSKMSSPIAALASFATVIVALFKESMLRSLHKAKFTINYSKSELLPQNRENGTSLELLSYQYFLGIENCGGEPAIDCMIEPYNIMYKKSSDKKFVSINKKVDFSNFLWKSEIRDIPVNFTRTVKLFDIKRPMIYGTPDDNKNISRSDLSFAGCKIYSMQDRKGIWQIDYILNCQNGSQLKFRLTLEWDGDFKTTREEMDNCVQIKINTL